MIVLVGKTCSGKDTIQKELLKRGLHSVVSYTTRPPRPGEIEGEAYHFISKEDFFERRKEGFFAETTCYNVAHDDLWYYGSAVEDLTQDKVIIVNPNGLRQLRYLKSLHPVAFYLSVSDEAIQKRLIQRGDDAEEAARRFKEDQSDFAFIEPFVDFTIPNEDTDPAEVADMILRLYTEYMQKG